MKLIALVVFLIIIVFVVLLPLLGFFIGLTTIIESDEGKDWEGARYIDGK